MRLLFHAALSAWKRNSSLCPRCLCGSFLVAAIGRAVSSVPLWFNSPGKEMIHIPNGGFLAAQTPNHSELEFQAPGKRRTNPVDSGAEHPICCMEGVSRAGTLVQRQGSCGL